jgi:hypothetical protein
MDKITLSNRTIVEMESVELPDGSVAKEFELPSGTARVRILEVSPMLISDTMRDRPDLVVPSIPKVEAKGVGGTKWLTAREGQEEYAAWEKERDRIDDLRGRVHDEMTWNFGVAEWKRPADAKEWMDEPPESWKFPARMKRLGKKPRRGADGRRLDYIRYVLTSTASNMEAIQMAMYGWTAPLIDQEVAAIAELFRGEEGREDDSGTTTE